MVQATVALAAPATPRSRADAAWREAALLLALAVPLLFAGLGVSFLDPDEGLYADVAAEMVRRADLVLPRFNGLPYLEKPPLYFWLGAAALWAGVPAELALRGVAALAALASVLLTWRIGRRLYGPEAGLCAALALMTTAGYALYIRKASTDLVFVATLTLALWGFVRDLAAPERGRGRFLFAYLGASLALLTKGLVGLVFVVVIVGVSALWMRGPALASLNLARGLGLAAVVAVPWHAIVAWREPGLMWFYLIDNQVLRFLGRRGFVEDDVPVGTLAFLVLSFIWLYPWSVFLPARSTPSAAPDGGRRVLVVWAVVVLAFFAVSRSKLEYYALPAFPALCVLAGAAWASGRDVGRWLRIGGLGSAVVGAAAIWAGATLTPGRLLAGLAELNVYYRILREQGAPLPFESVAPFGALLQALGALLVVGWGAAAILDRRGRRRAAFACIVAVGVGIAALIVQLLTAVEPHHSSKPVADAIRRAASADDIVAHEGSLEYSAALPFYAGRRIVVVNGTRGDLDSASRRPEAHGWFLDDAGFRMIWHGDRRVFLVTRYAADASVIRRVADGRAVLLGRFGARALYSNRPAAP